MKISDLLGKFRTGKELSYEEAKTLASSDDVNVRREVASHPDASPEILYFLAEDIDPDVRLAVANNQTTPRQADIILTDDKSDDVRSELAQKIAKLSPGLSANEVDKIRAMTYQALEKLAHDQCTKVRAIIAETLKDVADAPPEIINKLARDMELIVCRPILENSPVLTERDLMEIINHIPVEGSLSAISKRTDLPDAVMEAIYASEDVDAVKELLANPGSDIPDELLERICEGAAHVDAWAEELVVRPSLPKTVTLRLADFVAEHLVGALLKRKDLDPETAKKVKEEVSLRLDIAAEEEAVEQAETPMEKAKRLKKAGKLKPATVASALKANQNEYAKAVMAVLSGLPLKTVAGILSANSAKGVVALCWKAGISAKDAVDVQKRLGRIAPSETIKPEGNGYAINDEDMAWQLDLMKDMF
ncbi:MAG: DUF2336 domain-containing protein [Rhodospirillaceae bacterium]|nr:DUF2336 domain-containing protein [Rhodospirillaceae bacterium]